MRTFANTRTHAEPMGKDRTRNTTRPATLTTPTRTAVQQILGRPQLKSLRLSKPDDPLEQEANRVADEVMQMPEPVTTRTAPPARAQPPIQRLPLSPGSSQGTPVPDSVARVIPSSGGRSLDPASRAFFEPRFGADFSTVRIHTDDQASGLARKVAAKACTVGRDVFFADGRFQPLSPSGRWLLAHELTHTLQRGTGLKRGPGSTEGYRAQVQRPDGVPDAENEIMVLPESELGNFDWVDLYAKGEEEEQPALPGKTPKKVVSREEFDREKKMNACWRLLTRIMGSLGTKKTAWDIAYRTVGSAYGVAYRRHKKAVEDAAKEQALKEAIAFGILTTISVGALGWLGEAMEAGKLGKFLQTHMAGGIEDAIQDFVAEGIDVIQMRVTPTGAIVSIDPSFFRDELLTANDDQWLKVQEYFSGLRYYLEKRYMEMPETLVRIDLKYVEEAINFWLQDNRLIQEPRKHSVGLLADELERGIWAKWAPSLLIPTRPAWSYGGLPVGGSYYLKPGRPVEDRLNELGITKAAITGKTFGWTTSQFEISQFHYWGRTFRPKRFEF